MPVRLVSQEELPGPLKGYRLIDRLGRGGFGEVWKVEAPGGFLKAAKFVFGDLDSMDEDSRPAEQERKALERVKLIRHPYILSLERAERIDGQLIIIMELADRNLWDRFRECRGQGLPGVPRDELLLYMEESAEALDLMNNHYQIQHLDIKPQNLFLVFKHVKVADFGLAKLMERERATVTGGVTPVYAAPETFEGYISRFSDQYSLAIVYQELLTGVRPFNGANTRQLLMQHLSGSPDLHALPAADRPIIARGLSKKPNDRWPTCMDMVRALKLSGLAPPPMTPVSENTPTPGAPTDNAPADSKQVTRVQRGGPSRPTLDPAKTQTPLPAIRPAPPSPPGTGGGTMPPLITVGPAGSVVPRLVTPSPSANGPSPALTLHRPQIFQTARMHTHGVAPPEKNGDGVLFPALVIAVGSLGRSVVENLRNVIGDRYGSPEQVPNVRFLYIDTDPEAESVAARLPGSPAALTAKELVLTRLNRPAHYLQRESLPQLDQWLPPGALYKLPRNPGAANGVRAFGRLALFDHYRLVAQRVRQEVETFLTEANLAKADQATKFGLRTNRPRVYVTCGLGGGTGGGMFLDLAFLVRNELRGFGYLRPEVVGLFLVPPADKTAPKNAALGNAHAALAELYHFQARKTKYLTVFDKAEAPVADGEAPFARTMFLQLPKSVDPKGRGKVTARAARALFDEILTPAGRVVDEVRDVYRNAFPSPTPTCQVLSLFRLSWPRPEVLAAATRRFAQRLVQRWTAKDAAALRDPIGGWLDQQWEDRKLSFEQVIEAFETTIYDTLREEPERVFDAFIDPFRTRTPSGTKLDAAAACSVLEQLIKVVGKPNADTDADRGSLHAALATRYAAMNKDAESQLAQMAVTLIEQPQYRLAGAEEAVRQIEDRLKRQVTALESIHADLTKEIKALFTKLLQTIGGLPTGSFGWKASAEILDLLRAYPRKMVRFHVLDFALSAYRKLHGSTPEYLRDIGTCRAGLTEMHTAIGAMAPAGNPAGPGKLILPDGCANLDEAADRFLAGIDPADVLGFDQAIQQEATKKFRGLVAVCLKPAEKGPVFRDLLMTRAREFLDARLDAADPATVFFRCREGGGEADRKLIAEAFDGAKPEITGYDGQEPDEVTILAVPPGATGDRFRALVKETLPDVEFTPAPLPDDILFYREYPRLELADLPQFGLNGRDAAAQMSASEQWPHARNDVTWQPPERT
jgi:serine/threonine protein kinase